MLTDYSGVEIKDKEIAVSNYNLKNYPNPFNPETKIYFSTVEDAESVEISIYNINGQKIKTFKIPQSATCNPNSIVWNGVDDSGKPVSSGVYLYQLKVDGKQIDTKRCLLLK